MQKLEVEFQWPEMRLFLQIINLHLRMIRHNSCNKLSPQHSDHLILNMDTWRLQGSVVCDQFPQFQLKRETCIYIYIFRHGSI